MDFEVGECFMRDDREDDRFRRDEQWAFKVLAKMGGRHAYLEFLHLCSDPYIDVEYNKRAGEREVLPSVNIEFSPRDVTGYHYKQVSSEEYAAFRAKVLKLLALQSPDNPVFRNPVANQKLAKAEELVRMAAEYEKDTETVK